MHWKNFFGPEIYAKVKAYCEARKMSMASVVRDAVIRYIDKE